LQGLGKSGDANMDAIMLLKDTISRSVEAVDAIFKSAHAHGVPVAVGPAALVRNGGSVLSAACDILDQIKVARSFTDIVLKGAQAGKLPALTPESSLIINYNELGNWG
jgi:hypothetical protein